MLFPLPSPGATTPRGLFLGNPITRSTTYGDVGSDIVSIQSTTGKNPGPVVSVPQLLFVCGSPFILKGLANGVKGMAGLGRPRISLPSQFSTAFSFDRKFAICLTSSITSKGVLLFSNGPYVFVPNIDASSSLIYTPLIINPVSTSPAYYVGEPSTEYFIGVKPIKINEKLVPINSTLVTINKEGNGYTIFETSIYNAVIKAFVKELSNVPRVASVAPFGPCFSSKNIGSKRVGPAVPQIDLVLQSQSVHWRKFGANSMVLVSNDVLCLGFVDGGDEGGTSIVIGGHQIENNLLQFDIATSRLGFSSSLLFRQTTCANFNFSSVA